VWDDVVPALEHDFRVVLFDHVGCGLASRSAYRPERHDSLRGYAADLLDVVDAVASEPVIVVGHSISGMMGLLAATMLPDRFHQIIAINPSPRYINDGRGYVGGLDESEVMAMLDQIETNQAGWASSLAPRVMENSHRPELTDRLIRSFMAMDAKQLRRFAEVTFLCDFRSELTQVPVPVDILYGLYDRVVPVSVVNYMATRIPDARCTVLDAEGHYPQLSAPADLSSKIRQVIAHRLGG
jgi:sigma-B regulation protein RsbQ